MLLERLVREEGDAAARQAGPVRAVASATPRDLWRAAQPRSRGARSAWDVAAGSPGVLDKDARKTWNDNRHRQLQYIFPFRNGIINLEHPLGYPYPLETAPRELKIIHTDELDMKGTTGYDFREDWPTKEEDIADVGRFLRSCRMTEAEHDYCLMKDAATMLGANVFEEFEIWTGVKPPVAAMAGAALARFARSG